MGAPSKRAKKTKTVSDFDLVRISSELRSPRVTPSAYSWTLESIMEARAAQMAGRFKLAARLAASMKTDDALAVAYEGRLAPQRCVPVSIEPAGNSAKARGIANEAEALFGQKGIAIQPETLTDINGCLVDHGVAFATCVWTPRADGTRVDLQVKFWPIEFVRWDSIDRCFKAQVDPMGQPAVIPKPAIVVGEYEAYQSINYWEEPIVHGDGRWIIFAQHEHEPFKHCAILPGCMVWASHAYAKRDWSKSSVAHGNTKIVGEMPTGVLLQDDAGNPTPEAKAFLEALQSMASDDPVIIRPAGCTTEFVVNTSTAWQVFSELGLSAERGSARIYLGTDGILGAQGGAPGVNVEALFGVATTRVRGDLGCIERCLHTGAIEIWTAINHGDSTLSPLRRYQLPDDDKRALTTNDVAGGTITVNESREREGLGPLMTMGVDESGKPARMPDPRGDLTVTEFNAKVKAANPPPAATAPPPA